MKKFLIQAILLLAVTGISLYLFKTNTQISNLPFLPEQTVTKQLQINDATIKVEVADTQSKRAKGLGARQSLASDEGMLFIFPKPEVYPFWMKGLSFALDFVWIKGDTVVDLLQNIPPPNPEQTDASLPIYSAKEPIDKVLEIGAGTIQRLNIKVGDTVRIQ